VVILAVIVGVVALMPKEQAEPKEPPKTIYDMAKKDRAELLAEPDVNDFENEQAASSTEQQEEQAEPEKPAAPTVFYFKEVSEIEQIEADNILANVPQWRTIGRMPFTGYNLMVESCRQLMQRFPGTIYDYKARRALAQIPERYWQRYHITNEEVDLEYFTQQRPGTMEYTITEDD
jgi:hypothetical protein